jgi:cellulose synthase/poly-beta-1,6-N-acetylglucosamine synthase-like glycosyltransferase
LNASAIVPAHNEEQNIVGLLRRLHEESAETGLDDIIVVASGCTDGTVAAARAFADAHRPAHANVRVIEQAQREGKASAINAGLAEAQHDHIVLISGDVMPERGAVRLLLAHLDDEGVGVVGGRPVPLNDPSTFTGFATRAMWRMHHWINERSQEAKCGEMIAFRRMLDGRPIVTSIPVASAVDEVSIQAIVREAGLRSAYEPRAIVRNWGPNSVRQWMRQRRRINAGHLLSTREGYHPSTASSWLVVRALLADRPGRSRPHWLLAVAALEAAAKVAARFDVSKGEVHTVWRVAESTKRPIEQESA